MQYIFYHLNYYAIIRSLCLFQKVGQLKILLKSVLDQWSRHKVAFDEINSYLMEARYSLSRFRLLTGSLEAVQVQVDNLQVRDELNPSLTSFLIWEKFLKNEQMQTSSWNNWCILFTFNYFKNI